MQHNISILTLQTNLPCLPNEVSRFRSKVGGLRMQNDLFHNHDNSEEGGGKTIHRYPLIQYRSVSGKATIVGFNEGCEALWDLANSKDLEKKIPGIEVSLYPVTGIEKQFLRYEEIPKASDKSNTHRTEGYRYKAVQYKPFNNQQYAIYKLLPNFLARVAYLENCLEKHLRAAIVGLLPRNEFHTIPYLFLQVLDIDKFEKIDSEHEVAHLACDVWFETNVFLPNKMAIGNAAAYGRGILYKK